MHMQGKDKCCRVASAVQNLVALTNTCIRDYNQRTECPVVALHTPLAKLHACLESGAVPNAVQRAAYEPRKL